MTCQILFSRKNKKNVSKCCLLPFLTSMLSVNYNNKEKVDILLNSFCICMIKWNIHNYKSTVTLYTHASFDINLLLCGFCHTN